MSDETEPIPSPSRFGAEDIPSLEVTVWRLDANANAAADRVDGENAIGDSPEFSAKVIDFSSKDLKLALPFSAQFEEVIAVRLNFTDIQYSYMGQATVRHIRAENDLWIAGCAIEPNLADAVIDHLVTISGKERRRHPRSPIFKGEGWIRRAGDVDGSPTTIINISKGGICASLSMPLSVGERVQLLTCNKKGDLETISVQIRWQSEIEGGHKIGCSFCEAKAYRKLMYCLTNETALSVLIKQESTKWYVLAAAMLAMSVPPAVHLATNALKDQNKAQTAKVAPVDNSQTTPVSIDPLQEEPTSEETTTEEPTTEEPTTEEPTTEEPTTEEPTTEEPTTEEPTTEEPTSEEPTTEEPTSEEPTTEEPTTEELPTMKLAKKPAKKPRTQFNPVVETQPNDPFDQTEKIEPNDDVGLTEPDLNDFVEDESSSPDQTTIAFSEDHPDIVATQPSDPRGKEPATPAGVAGGRGSEGHPSASSSARPTYDVPIVKDVRTDRGIPDVPFEQIEPVAD